MDLSEDMLPGMPTWGRIAIKQIDDIVLGGQFFIVQSNEVMSVCWVIVENVIENRLLMDSE